MYRSIGQLALCGIVARSMWFPAHCGNGSNPFDCKNPACHGKMDMLLQAMDKRKNTTRKHAAVKKECPLDRDELGNATWKLLHTIAANYPENPTPADVNGVVAFITTLSKLYPCPYCAKDFREAIKASPVE